MLLLHEKIHWCEYKSYEEEEVERLVLELGAFLNQYYRRNFTYDYYYALLYMELSEIIFAQYIMNKGLIGSQGSESLWQHVLNLTRKNIKSSNMHNFEKDFDGLDANKTEVASLLFFHRHNLFEMHFKNEQEVQNLTKPSNYIEAWDEHIYRRVVDIFGFIYDAEMLKHNAILATLCGNTIQKEMERLSFPDVLLTNSHGLYHNTLVSFYIANMVSHKKSIIINQPGFVIPHLEHINQYEYEKNICSKYLAWLKEPFGMEYDKFVSFGSFYASRTTGEKPIEATLIVLPQAPSKLRPFSIYYGDYTLATQHYLIDLLRQIKRNLYKFPNKVVLRCKSMDYPAYQSMMGSINLKIPLEGANVNNPEEQYVNYDTIITTYTSTSIIESIDKADRVYFVIDRRHAKLRAGFDKEFFELENCYETFDDFGFNDYDVDALMSFKHRYGFAIDSEESSSKLKTVLNQI